MDIKDRATEICLQARDTELDNEVINDCDGDYNNDDESQPVNFEAAIASMGPPGWYQILQIFLMTFNFIPVIFINMSYVYLGMEPQFACSQINESAWTRENHFATNETISYTFSYKDCEIQITSNTSGTYQDIGTMACTEGYTYSSGKHTSIVSEWDLVCKSRGIAEMAQTVMSLGWSIGIILTSAFSDKYGRKKTVTIAIFMSSLSELGAAFSPNVFAMIAFRFFSGFFGSGISSSTLVLGAEFLVSKHRARLGVYIGLQWPFVSMLLCGIAYGFRDHNWRELHICLSACCIFPLLLIYFVDESASWLFSHGNYQKAEQILQKACRFNGLNFDDVVNVWKNLCNQECQSQKVEKATKNYNILDIFRNKKLRKCLVVSWLVTFTTNISYIGMYLSASTLAGNLYLNTALMSFLEVPGCLLGLIVLRYYGRRFAVIFSMASAAVFLLVSTSLEFVDDKANTQHIVITSTVCYLLGRLVISISFNINFLYLAELFPTTLRTSGMGLCITGGCLGGMLAPYLVPLHAMEPWLPGMCLISFLIISSLLLSKLPETKGSQLASKMET